MTVRAAMASDKLQVVRMLRDAHAAGRLPFPFSAAHASILFDQQCSEPNRICLVLDTGNPGGVLMASAQDHPFAAVRYALEVVWWIDRSHRGKGATAMLDAFEAWAKSQNCVFAGMASLATAPRAAAIYGRSGYQPFETHHIKKLEA